MDGQQDNFDVPREDHNQRFGGSADTTQNAFRHIQTGFSPSRNVHAVYLARNRAELLRAQVISEKEIKGKMSKVLKSHDMASEFLKSISQIILNLIADIATHLDNLTVLLKGLLPLTTDPIQPYTLLWRWSENFDSGELPIMDVTYRDDKDNLALISINFEFEKKEVESCFLFYRTREIYITLKYHVKSDCVDLSNYDHYKVHVNEVRANEAASNTANFEREAKIKEAETEFKLEQATIEAKFTKLQVKANVAANTTLEKGRSEMHTKMDATYVNADDL